jgi:hypothetical protein
MSTEEQPPIVLYCIVIEHLDGAVSANGPYASYDAAVVGCRHIAEFEARSLETTFKHEPDGSTVGDDEAGEDTMTLWVQSMGLPVDAPIDG